MKTKAKVNPKVKLTELYQFHTAEAEAIFQAQGLSPTQLLWMVCLSNQSFSVKINAIGGVCKEGICVRSFSVEYPEDCWAVLEFPIVKFVLGMMEPEAFELWAQQEFKDEITFLLAKPRRSQAPPDSPVFLSPTSNTIH